MKWPLDSPLPRASAPADPEAWHHRFSNYVLDFHGDPLHAQLVIFSDGNHHMALAPAIRAFQKKYPAVQNVFYATTPPAPLAAMLRNRPIAVGNLVLSVKPHVFISPPHIMEELVQENLISSHRFLVKNQGSVLLVKKGNPKSIGSVTDLLRPEITTFISHPETEAASHDGYARTLEHLSQDPGFLSKIRLVTGKRIHHREGPEAVKNQTADAAILYYHLALYLVRLFPDEFMIIPLGGCADRPAPLPGNQVSTTHIARVGTGGDHGRACIDFFASDTVKTIYRSHGLIPAL